MEYFLFVFFFSSRRRHTRSYGDWSSDVCSSDLAGDLDAFDRRYSINGGGQTLYQQYGAASSFLSVAKPQGAPANSAGWAGEIALDVEWAHAVAPGAKILLVEARSSSLSDLLGAVNYA